MISSGALTLSNIRNLACGLALRTFLPLIALSPPSFLAKQQTGSPPLIAYLDRSYYTTEKDAWVICEASDPEGLNGARLSIRKANGDLLGVAKITDHVTKIGLAVNGMSV